MPWSSPASSGPQPPLSPTEMELLVTRTGLALNPGQMADLVLAWRQLAGLIAAIPREPVPADDQAFVFRLPVPPAPRAAEVGRKPSPKAKPATKAKPGKAARPTKTAPKKTAQPKASVKRRAGKTPARSARKR